jgi:hypothetical protein
MTKIMVDSYKLGLVNGRSPTRTFHLSTAVSLVTRQILPNVAVGLPSHWQGRERILFMAPWQDCSLIGTWHAPYWVWYPLGAGLVGPVARGDLVDRRLKGREVALLMMSDGWGQTVGGRIGRRPLPGPGHAIGRYPFAQVVDGRYDSIFQPHFGRLPAGLVGGSDERQVAVGFVAFFQDNGDDDLVGLVIGFGPGQGAVVEDEGQVGHDNMDCSRVGGFLPDVGD